jgi:hypothetical protein
MANRLSEIDDHGRKQKRNRLRLLLAKKIRREEQESGKWWKRMNPKFLWIAIGFNVLLLLDFYVLRAVEVRDVIASVDVIRTRKSHYANIQLSAGSGAHWFIESTGYELAGHEIRYERSPIFSIVRSLYNLSSGREINRYYSADLIVPVTALFCLALAVSGFLARNEHGMMGRTSITHYCLIIVTLELVFILV